MKILISYITKFLLYIVSSINRPTKEVQSINRQDVELITKNFPLFNYKKGMSTEDIALETMWCYGEQKVIQFLMLRIQGRIGQGVLHD